MSGSRLFLCLSIAAVLLFVTLVPFQPGHARFSKIEVLEAPITELSFEAFEPTLHSELSDLAKYAQTASAAPFMAVLTNRSKYDIVALNLVWTMTNTRLRRFTHTGRFDSFFFQTKPLVASHEQRAVLQQGLLGKEVFKEQGKGIYIMPSEAAIEALQAAALLTVEIDAVLFSNGYLAGPDNTRLIEHIRTRNLAAKNFAHTVLESERSARYEMLQMLISSSHESDFHRFQATFANELLPLTHEQQQKLLLAMIETPEVLKVARRDVPGAPLAE